MPTGHANRLLPSLRRVVLVRHHAELSDGQLLAAFVTELDGDAFAALVRRHGAMVLGVCRRVVGDAHTAEDAFQAVFLVLARRAAAVRPRAAVGNWLYGVAFRTAIKARSVLARRRSREKQVDAMPEPHAPAPADVWSDLQPVLDEELARLPDKLRLPVVLCDLEGRPQRDVARHLKIPSATLTTRLAAARRTLAARLTKRGVTLSGGALAGVLTSHATASAVSHRLADAAVRAAEAVAAGDGLGVLVSAQAVQLSEGVMRMMLVTKLKVVGVAVVAALGLTTGLGAGLVPARADDKPAKPAAAKPAEEPDAVFLDRVCRDLRGSGATGVEKGYFAADRDAGKRRKVIDWFLADEATRAFLAKKHGATADGAAVVGFLDAGTVPFRGAGQELRVQVTESPAGAFFLGLGVNGGAGVTGDVGVDERNDLFHALTRQAVANPAGDAGNPPVAAWYLRLARTRQPDPQPATQHFRALVGVFDPPHPPTLLQYQHPAQPQADGLYRLALAVEGDADFLKRVVKDARGTDPTVLETKYFAEDKDPRKREKLLDALLKEPGLAKKLGDGWKKKMLEPPSARPGTQYQDLTRHNYRAVTRLETAKQPDRLDKLVGELIDAKKTDAQILDAVTLAVVGRMPADGEKLTLAAVAKAADRKAAWAEVIKALAATDEARKYAADLTRRNPPPAKP